MHCIVAWNITSSENRRAEIDDAMTQGIKGYSWVHPLDTVYIIKMHTDQDWFTIKQNLCVIAGQFPEEVNFMLSPLYEGETEYYIHRISDDNLYKIQ